MKFDLYAISNIENGLNVNDEYFTLHLPYSICEGVLIEPVSGTIDQGTFDSWEPLMGKEKADILRRVEYALVHRFRPASQDQDKQEKDSEDLLRDLAALLRLIRPSWQRARLMRGYVMGDGKFSVTGSDDPADIDEVPENQKLFGLRNRDAVDLKTHSAAFLKAMRGEFWKFRMAVQFHELGHFQDKHPKARYLLWCSAIEAIYTSNKQRGSHVAKERIKWFLGPQTNIYASGELSDLVPNPGITISGIVDDLYDVRNYIAHGDRLPDKYFDNGRGENTRCGINGQLNTFQVLFEAASFIIRKSLLKILRENLLDHFVDAGPADKYFAVNGLSNDQLPKKIP